MKNNKSFPLKIGNSHRLVSVKETKILEWHQMFT